MLFNIDKRYFLKEDKISRSKSFYLLNPYQKIDKKIIEFLKNFSKKNKDCDVRVCLHTSPKDKHHDMIVLQHSKYFYPPHKHLDFGDTIYCINGILACFIFQNNGKIKYSCKIRPGEMFKVKKNVYHCLIPLKEIAIFLETRAGPFNPKKRYVTAKWCPNLNNNLQINKFKKRIFKFL
jgi:cupin fold WbuC family metalloprotein